MNAKSLCVVAVAVALGLAACGDDDDDSDSGTTGTTGTAAEEELLAPTGPPKETIKLTETEFAIEPADVRVDEEGIVEFEVANAGSVTHALEVEGGPVEQETAEIAPGESASLEVRLAEGTYELYCPIGDHADQGMTGELTVGRAGSTGADESSGEGDSSGEDDSGGQEDNSGGAEAPGEDDDDSGGAEAPSSGY